MPALQKSDQFEIGFYQEELWHTCIGPVIWILEFDVIDTQHQRIVDYLNELNEANDRGNKDATNHVLQRTSRLHTHSFCF